MRKFICLLLCSAMLLTAFPASAGFFTAGRENAETAGAEDTFRYEGPGFDTPEDAVLYYLAGLKNLDIQQMLGAFAWETLAANYSYRDALIYQRGIDPTVIPSMPFSGDFMTAANLEAIRERAVQYIYLALEICMLGDNHWMFTTTYSTRLPEDTDADTYLELFDPEILHKLAEMNNVRFYDPDDITGGRFSMNVASENPKRQESYQRNIGRYGADEIQYRVAAADVGDDVLYVMPTIARYGDRWYLVSYSGIIPMILGIDVNHQAFFLRDMVFKTESDDAREWLLSAVPVQTASLPETKYESVHYEGPGFDTPEDVVVSYMEGIRKLDMQQMLGAFAWETQVARYSLKNQLLRLRCVYSNMPVRMPSMDGWLDGFNTEALRSQESGKIYKSIRSYVAGGGFLNGMRVDLRTEEETDEFILKVTAAQISRIPTLAQTGDISVVSPEILIPEASTPSSQAQLEVFRGVYGADELQELIGMAPIGDETLFCDLLIARYDDRWYAVSAGGLAFSLLGLNAEDHAFASSEYMK